MDYLKFLQQKANTVEEQGFDPDDINNNLFPFQRDIVKKALKVGRYAVFADCGLGKTLMQLEIARQCAIKTKGNSLILAPLAVVEQTIQEGRKFGIDVCDPSGNYPIHITNYEQLKNIDPGKYECICLDESSILKAFQGKTKKAIINAFSNTRYRFCFTATPSPNDTMELGNHSEFLGQMAYKNMLSMYFVNDMDTVQKWRLKGHAFDKFWKWVSEWAICVTSPEDLGYEMPGYKLPGLNINQITIQTEKVNNGMLFNSVSVNSTNHNQELRRTSEERISKAVKIANATGDPVIVWVKHNDESKKLSSLIDGAKEVTGSMKDQQKKDLLLGFARGEFRVLVTKPKIAQYGLNYQHCNKQIFTALDFSFEGTYQAIRRSYRFGQKKAVEINLITTDTMQNVVESINRKQAEFKIMQESLRRYA